MSTGTDQVGPDDGPVVEQQTGTATGAEGGADADDTAAGREVGVTAAVERGPAELSSDGDPVPDNPNISLEDREPARSTDEL